METITQEELKSMNQKKKDFVLINVLESGDFNQDHIRTSINVPVSDKDFVSRVESITGSKDREVIVYCASFDCDASRKAATKLDEAGFQHVYDYEGGLKDWQQGKEQA